MRIIPYSPKEANLIDVFVGKGWKNASRYRSVKQDNRRSLHYVLGNKLSRATLEVLNTRT